MRAIAILGLCLAFGCSSANSSEGTSADVLGTTDGTADSGSVASADTEQPVDSGSLDARASEDAGEPDAGLPIVEAPPYDFASAAPWYECSTAAFPEEAVVVNGFSQVDQYFGGGENFREVEIDVEFPPTGSWSQVGMLFRLECPESGICDHWDRTGSLSMVLGGAEDENPEHIELARHITPYRMGMCQYIDITGLAPLLTGKRTLKSWIDTWVGPGHSDGEGWRVTTQFVFYPGKPKAPDEVINIWGRRQITVGEVEPDVNVDSQIEPKSFTIPADTTRVIAHLTTTGHSFGNSLNCAEFCEMSQDVYINGTKISVNPWRDDCAENPVSPQAGTWQYARNGWCPGAIVTGQQLDVTKAMNLGAENEIDFDIRLANGAEYDNYTPVDLLPSEYVSLKLYVWR